MAAADGQMAQPSPQVKKRKVSEDENDLSIAKPSAFQDFKLLKILRMDDRHKLINLHGSLPLTKSDTGASAAGENTVTDESDAVVVLERKPFDQASIEECIRNTKTIETLKNDVYTTFDIFSNSLKADMKATLIFPATEKHISKYSEHEPFIIHETPELYRDVTLPCIEAGKFSIQWVYNILEKKKEAERIVTEDSDSDSGFILIPDMKWDGEKIESLYLVAIAHNRNLKSIRDLRAEHLPLLKNILKKGQDSIKQKYNVGPDKLRVYFHYQPSYHHLHIHFTHLQFDAPGSDVMRAHLLNDVIDNLTIDSEFYQKKTLSYVVRNGDSLYKAYKDHGYFQ